MKEETRKDKLGRVYSSKNASRVYRDMHVTHCGITIIMTGKKGFGWEVTESDVNNHIKITSFNSSKEAKEYYNNLIRNYKVKIKM